MKDHPSQWIASGLRCRDVTDRATEYLEERLPILTKIRVGLHLASCPGCRVYMRQLSLIGEMSPLLPKLYPSPIHRLHLRRHYNALHGHPWRSPFGIDTLPPSL